MEKLKTVDPKIEQKYKPFARMDKENWSRWKFYLGSLTVFPKLLVFLPTTLTMIGGLKYATRGIDTSQPLPAETREKVKKYLRNWLKITCLIFGIKINIDDRRTEEDKEKFAPIIVGNHISWFDTWFLAGSEFCPSFLGRGSVRKLPLVSSAADALQTIFFKRSSAEDRRAALNAALERQELIWENREYPQMCLFPEGTTTNGTELLKFQKGAFVGGYPIQPIVFQYPLDETVTADYTLVSMVPHFFIYAGQLSHIVNVTILPIYEPSHEEQIDWELFAENVRDIIARVGDMEKGDFSARHNLEYEGILLEKYGIDL
eukprot:CAMPEP_0114981004 /NCGR_PEP_ID=MMETSP0216-20121206/5295_1 /TAXON_ID=223996 /ORGANISM="Protocruzia adherens, Strain Boccale" /LENGTH=316 /DNA_ID=CAMNT_0002342611 /DNA_START=68 /DNA_END=1018 /DNA_ORIENTATION=+